MRILYLAQFFNRPDEAGAGRHYGFATELVRAGLPADEQHRSVPVRTLPGFENPALPAHPSGYLLVGVDRRYVEDASSILAALRDWTADEPLVVTARLNPHLAFDVEWWECEVRLALPE